MLLQISFGFAFVISEINCSFIVVWRTWWMIL